jgi:hypothetical protein
MAMSTAPEPFNTSEFRPEPDKGVGWRIAASIATGAAAALLTVTIGAHAAPPPHRITLDCTRKPSGVLWVHDPQHMMRGSRPYTAVHTHFGAPEYGGWKFGECTLVREG